MLKQIQYYTNKNRCLYNYYKNTKKKIWIGRFTNGLTCQTEKTDCLPDYPYTPPFSGRGRVCSVMVPFGDYRSGGLLWHFTINKQSIFVYRHCTLILQYLFCLFWEMFTNKNAVTPPITQRLNGDLQNCII